MDLLTEPYGYGDIARRVTVLGLIGLIALSQILCGCFFGRIFGFKPGSRRDHDRDILYPITCVRGKGDGFWWVWSCYWAIILACGYIAYLQLPDQSGPPHPTDLNAICVEPSVIQLSWTAPSREVGPSAYVLYRDLKPLPERPSDEFQIGLCHGLSYHDHDVQSATTYYYRVAARYRWEELAFSDEASDRTP